MKYTDTRLPARISTSCSGNAGYGRKEQVKPGTCDLLGLEQQWVGPAKYHLQHSALTMF